LFSKEVISLLEDNYLVLKESNSKDVNKIENSKVKIIIKEIDSLYYFYISSRLLLFYFTNYFFISHLFLFSPIVLNRALRRICFFIGYIRKKKMLINKIS